MNNTEPNIEIIPPIHVATSSGRTEKLVDFVANLLFKGKSTLDIVQLSPAEEMQAERRALEALRNIRNSMERNKPLNASDVQDLTQTHLLNIWREGDDYLRKLLKQGEPGRERERKRYSDEWDDICCFRGRITWSFPCNGLSPGCPYRDDEREKQRMRNQWRDRNDYGRER